MCMNSRLGGGKGFERLKYLWFELVVALRLFSTSLADLNSRYSRLVRDSNVDKADVETDDDARDEMMLEMKLGLSFMSEMFIIVGVSLLSSVDFKGCFLRVSSSANTSFNTLCSYLLTTIFSLRWGKILR
jgi:hypothetical protein